MKTFWAAVALVLSAVGAAAPGRAQAQAPDAEKAAKAAAPANPEEKALAALHEAFVKAYNAEDSAALAALYTEDAAVVNSSGEATRGRKDIAAMYASAFEEVADLKLESDFGTVHFLTPDVAQVEGRARISGGGGNAVQLTKFSSLLVKKGGEWKIAEVRDYPTPEPDMTPYDRLAELEWMVGDWVDEGSDAKVTAQVRWADNKSYLVRHYNVEVGGKKAVSGTMFIGWDPQTGQIKSWAFDSEGGRGEGLWTRASESQWVVKAHGVLHDGRPTSATQIHTVVNKDSAKTHSIDRIIGGGIAPDVPEGLMVRKPPTPREAEKKDGK